LWLLSGGKEMNSSPKEESVVVRKTATSQDNNTPVFCKAEQITLNLSKNTSTKLVVKCDA